MASILKVDTIQDQSGNNIINENADTITIGASGDTITVPTGATFSAPGIANTPAFMAYNNGSTTQSITTGVWTEVTIYNTEKFDSDSAYNTTTCRFTPQVAGKYFFTAQIFIPTGSAAGTNAIIIGKNGSATLNSTDEVGWLTALEVGGGDFRVNGILNLNGTTDYVSVLMNQQTGGSKTIGGGSGASITFFGGYRLIGA